jgi:hypothetical protein
LIILVSKKAKESHSCESLPWKNQVKNLIESP